MKSNKDDTPDLSALLEKLLGLVDDVVHVTYNESNNQMEMTGSFFLLVNPTIANDGEKPELSPIGTPLMLHPACPFLFPTEREALQYINTVKDHPSQKGESFIVMKVSTAVMRNAEGELVVRRAAAPAKPSQKCEKAPKKETFNPGRN